MKREIPKLLYFRYNFGKSEPSVAVPCSLIGGTKQLWYTGKVSAVIWWSVSARSQWPRGIRRGSTFACLLGLRVRILSEFWMSAFCERCGLSGRGLCIELITLPGEFYRVLCVCVSSGATVTCTPTVSRFNGVKTRKERKIPFVVLWFIQLDDITSGYPMFVCLFFFLARQPPMVQGLLIHEVSISHTTTLHSR